MIKIVDLDVNNADVVLIKLFIIVFNDNFPSIVVCFNEYLVNIDYFQMEFIRRIDVKIHFMVGDYQNVDARYFHKRLTIIKINALQRVVLPELADDVLLNDELFTTVWLLFRVVIMWMCVALDGHHEIVSVIIVAFLTLVEMIG